MTFRLLTRIKRYTWWRPSYIFLSRFFKAYIPVVFYNSLCAFQFDTTAGLSHIISSAPLTDDEKLWLAANIALLVIQLALLTRMWTMFRARATMQSKEGAAYINPGDKVELDTLIDLLPCWGLLRGSRWLCSLLRKMAPSASAVTAGLVASPTTTATVAFMAFILSLLVWFGVRSMRLVTLVFPLLVVDAHAVIPIMGLTASAAMPAVFTGIEDKPRFGFSLFLLWEATLVLSGSWKYCVILPPLSASIILCFLLVRHTPEYLVEPLPLPPSPITPSRPFCKVCRHTILAKIKSNPPKDGPSFTHHWTTRSLRKSATEGCRICATIWRGMATRQVEHFFEALHLGRTTTWGVFSGNVIFIDSKWQTHICRFQFISSTATDTFFRLVTFHSWPPRRPRLLEDHTGSDTSLNFAREWLSTCIRNHSSCCASIDVHFRPSRLLHLGADDHVRLHTSEEFPEGLSYMTLSHCWGGASFIQLRQSNQQSFRRGIPWESLPQTFKDAIRIAKQMGADYLWIDSLCILQDSPEDWLVESAMMRSIYKNATCNIAASDAANSLEGCLYPRNHRTLTPERLHLCSDGDDDPRILNIQSRFTRSNRLYSRAWVLQEALLAPRTLDCGRDQLFWRCDESKASEEGPGGLPPSWSVKYHHPSHGLLGLTLSEVSSLRLMAKEMEGWEASNRDVLQTSGPRGNSEAVLRAYDDSSSPSSVWINIVEIYSRMALTRDTDRPVAMMGILDTFRPYLGQYLAGMWEHLLPLHLLWSTREDNDFQPEPSRCYRPSPRRAPSWSWMSLEGPIHLKGLCEVLLKDVLLSQFLDIENVSDHDIRLRIRTSSLVRVVRVDKWTGVVPRALLALGFKPVVAGLRIEDSTGTSKWQLSRPRLVDDDEDPPVIRFDFDEAHCEETVLDVALMPIRQRSFDVVDGLVLQENTDGTFTRVGHFWATKTLVGIFSEGEQTEVVLV